MLYSHDKHAECKVTALLVKLVHSIALQFTWPRQLRSKAVSPNLCDVCVQVGSIVNLSLMYLLAPTASSTAGKSLGFVQRLFSDQILQAWGAPTGHMFERGYPFASRVVNLGYKVAYLCTLLDIRHSMCAFLRLWAMICPTCCCILSF